jgi:biopolymer transport protein ExbB
MGSDRLVQSLLTAILVSFCFGVYAQAPAPEAAPPAPALAAPAPAPAPAPAAEVQTAAAPTQAAPRITLWWMLEKGGLINWLILAMSVVAVIMTIYLLLTVTTSREVPQQLVKRAQAQIRAGDLRGAYEMCEGRDELFARVLEAGLRRGGSDRYVIQEAMESEGERGATALWQRISYLNNIGAIAPLMGLLGTVWGMIRAFSGIAFENSAAKGLVMAEGVAQAMITTACGLMLAIPALLVYYYLRGRVIKIVAEVEAEASEIIELLARREA